MKHSVLSMKTTGTTQITLMLLGVGRGFSDELVTVRSSCFAFGDITAKSWLGTAAKAGQSKASEDRGQVQEVL
jgi:hypothetical protein